MAPIFLAIKLRSANLDDGGEEGERMDEKKTETILGMISESMRRIGEILIALTIAHIFLG